MKTPNDVIGIPVNKQPAIGLQVVYCAECRQPNRPNAKFCIACSAELALQQVNVPKSQGLSVSPSIVGASSPIGSMESPQSTLLIGTPPLLDGVSGNLPGPLSTMRAGDWMKVVVGGFIFSAICLIVFVMPLFTPLYVIPIGYSLLLGEQIIRTGRIFPLPRWSNWLGILKKGLAFVLIHFVYAIPGLMVLFGVPLTSSSSIELSNSLLLAGAGMVLVSWLFSDVAICNYLERGKVLAAFHLGKVLKVVWFAWLRLLLGYLGCFIAFIFLQLFGALLIGIGLIVTLFISFLLYGGIVSSTYRNVLLKRRLV